MQPEGMPDMGAILQQAQQMQEGLARAQEELAKATVEGSAGGGLVKVQMSGTADIQSVEIDPKVIDPDDAETLQDLVVAAVRDAAAKAGDLTQQTMGGVTGGMGGLGLPGL